MSDTAGPQPATHCYRHPGREANISCQRCGRPICPDCMRDASVGFHCPECVAEGARSVRAPRTVAGGRLPSQVGAATLTLIGVNAVVFGITLLTGGSQSTVFEQGAMLSSTAVNSTGNVLTGVADGAYWRLITSAFLHQGFLHILFNMYALYIFGPMLEQALGLRRYLAMYVTTAVAASVFVYFLAPANALTIGASGAVFGLFAVALVMLIKARKDVRFLLLLLVLNGLLSTQGNISWQGHLGGFVSGAILGAAFAYAPREHRRLAHSLVFAAMWVAIIVGILVRTAQLQA